MVIKYYPAKYTKSPTIYYLCPNEEILELISGLDYIGNLPTVPDLGKPIEIQVSTTRQIPLEQKQRSPNQNQRDNIQ